MAARNVKHIDLALQGGGAHGAFTWGVLERLLEDERLEIDGISGTSAGALNAVVLADGLMAGGRKGARQALSRFWSRVSNASAHVHGVAAFFGHWPGAAWPWNAYIDWLGQSLSPQQLNPLDLNPLRDIVASAIDFERVRACDKLRLFVSATNVRTGELKEFRQPELTVDAVMASACLPMLFRPVEIDGEAYWDGGYVANPSLLPLVANTAAHDLLLVQINPSRREELPRRASEIIDRVNEITFNSSLVKELRTLHLLQRALQQEAGPPKGQAALFAQIAALKLHRIHASAEISQFGVRSKSNTAWVFLKRLHGIGYRTANDWLDANFTHLGRRSTLDLEAAAA